MAVSSISLNLLFSLSLSMLLFLFSDGILQFMNIPEELMAEASTYLDIVGSFIFVQALIMTVSAILRSYGFTKDTKYVTILMNIINAIGNYFMIFGPFGLPVFGVEGGCLYDNDQTLRWFCDLISDSFVARSADSWLNFLLCSLLSLNSTLFRRKREWH
ncbi:MATE family efflux transporter [Gracilibacillus caseinilyticus]|uniref:MATE family efflux transporter n=1 Tax=Gracilibacillus caseinilyticus TaxID=2932256 RepID=A0ABY4F1N5_9BACI|nr:MATE family efflux transporter [Gracilibacillus caseinilyticus]UOQ50586.1 MATE family efflux transporter [Gracilibacillus caseinilyticus]